MPLPPLPIPSKPIVTYQALIAGLSAPRLAAYYQPDDKDCGDGVARYFWNSALAGALWPALHVLEIVVRNTIYAEGAAQTATRSLRFNNVPCWLDAGLLEQREQDEVNKAIKRLALGQRTPGHLIGALTFGFWVRLCNRPYEHGKGRVAIWPSAAKRFHGCPRRRRNRRAIASTLRNLADFRNRVAHHHPVWDRRPDRRLADVVQTIRWLNPQLADAVSQTSNVAAMYAAGHSPFRPMAEATCALFL